VVEAAAAVASAEDPYDLHRFEVAQDGVYESALAQLHAGRKTGHWMWFVFPQIAGLGLSAMSQRYAISSAAEARAYLEHPVLGPRIAECARALTDLDGRSAEAIFGGIDAVKLRSSMTLFVRASDGDPTFQAVLDRYFGGEADPRTDALL
jgi:uncharacterized protein (DUF1810 family)